MSDRDARPVGTRARMVRVRGDQWDLDWGLCSGQATPVLTMTTGSIALLVFLSLLCFGDTSAVRTKRHILFNPGNGQLIIGFGIPVPLQNHAVTLGVVIKYDFPLPSNATELLTPYVVTARGQQRRNSMPMRWMVYEGMAAAISKLGHGMDGHQCLLRMICEAATVPFDHNTGLAGELIYILLTPSSSNEIQESKPERDYAAAERSGREGMKGCATFQKTCPISLLDLFSRLGTL